MVFHSYNAAKLAAQSDKALIIWLAANRKTVNPDDLDNNNLTDSVVLDHAHLTRDIEAERALAILDHRQI